MQPRKLHVWLGKESREERPLSCRVGKSASHDLIHWETRLVYCYDCTPMEAGAQTPCVFTIHDIKPFSRKSC